MVDTAFALDWQHIVAFCVIASIGGVLALAWAAYCEKESIEHGTTDRDATNSTSNGTTTSNDQL